MNIVSNWFRVPRNRSYTNRHGRTDTSSHRTAGAISPVVSRLDTPTKSIASGDGGAARYSP